MRWPSGWALGVRTAMADPLTPKARVLDDWRAGLRQERHAARQGEDRLIALWSGLVLVLMLLYLMIGPTPYQHEVTLDPLTGAAVASPLNRIVWLGLLGLSAPIYWFRRREILDMSKRLWPLLLLFFWFAATTRWAIDPGTSNKRLVLYVINLLVAVALVAGLRDARRMHAALATACAAIILIDLASWIVMPAKSMSVLGLAAIHNHKNTLGSVMLLSSLVISPYVLFQPRLRERLFWGALFLGCVALLIGSKSKTSMAIVLVSLAVIPLLLIALRLRSGALLALLISAGLAVVAALFGWLAWCYAAGLDPLYPIRDVTFTQRTDVWRFALNQFAQRPLKGLGFASFWDVDPMVQPSLQTDEWFAQPNSYTNESHNGYIDLLVTTGVPGLVGAMFLLVRWTLRGLGLIRQSLRAPPGVVQRALPHNLFLGVFPLMFFIHNWMESSFFTANAMFGIIILLVAIDIDTRHGPGPAVIEPRRRALSLSEPQLLPPGWRS
jgi:O-antigen ligase